MSAIGKLALPDTVAPLWIASFSRGAPIDDGAGFDTGSTVGMTVVRSGRANSEIDGEVAAIVIDLTDLPKLERHLTESLPLIFELLTHQTGSATAR